MGGWPWQYALACVLACTCRVAAAHAQAEPARGEPDRCVASPLAAAAAVVPGVLVHGAGHRVGGDRRMARRLLVLEGVALGAMGISGAALGLSGASRRLSLPTIPLLIGGGGLFFMSWGADIYGAAGGPRIAGTARLEPPVLETRLGYLHVHDPQFAYAHFTDVAAHVRAGGWRAGAHAQIAMDNDNQRVQGMLEHRFVGPRRRGQARDGTALDLQGAVTWHDYGTEGFASITGKLVVSGRYDLVRLSPTMAGAFAALGAGLGMEVTTYEGAQGFDAVDRLLAHFAFGMYLGTPGAVHGEVELGYDHDRDGLTGGLAGSSGFLGYVGARGFIMFGPRWGVAADLRVGSAYVGGASLIYSVP